MGDEEFRNALPIGREIEGYRIDSVLGAGGFGITYKATELSLDRDVAIKEYLPMAFAMRLQDTSAVVPASTHQEGDFAWGLTRFKQEAQVLIQLRHPNIVPVLRFFEAFGTAYMVMEYQHGDSLGGVLREGGTLSQQQLDQLLPPILDALESVHDAGFLHRDLKPDNIYVREDGSPVILDFGAARQALGQRSQSLTAIVSEGYAPYEQYEREGNQGPWTDIYALGAVLYRCVTGQRPVESPARASAAFRGAPDPLTPAQDGTVDPYRPPLFAAIDQALKVLETARPQSIPEFRDILTGEVVPEPVVSGDAPTQMPATPAGQSLADAAMAPTMMPDNPPADPASAEATAIGPEQTPSMAPTRMGGSPAAAVPPAAAETSGKAASKRSPAMIGAVAVGLLLVAGGGFFALSSGGGGSDGSLATSSQANRDASRILAMAGRQQSEAEMLRGISTATSGRQKSPAGAGGPLKTLFANRRIQTILPGRSSATLLRFRASGGLSAVTTRPERDGGDITESGTWTVRGKSVCLKLAEWNSGRPACFTVRHNGDVKSKRVPVNARGKAGAFRGTLTY